MGLRFWIRGRCSFCVFPRKEKEAKKVVEREEARGVLDYRGCTSGP